MRPDPDGEWVRFLDAAAISNRLASSLHSETRDTNAAPQAPLTGTRQPTVQSTPAAAASTDKPRDGIVDLARRHLNGQSPAAGVELAQEILRLSAFAPSAEQPRHICGVRGWNPDLDGPCPACTPSHVGDMDCEACGKTERAYLHSGCPMEGKLAPSAIQPTVVWASVDEEVDDVRKGYAMGWNDCNRRWLGSSDRTAKP